MTTKDVVAVGAVLASTCFVAGMWIATISELAEEIRTWRYRRDSVALGMAIVLVGMAIGVTAVLVVGVLSLFEK